MTKATKLWQQYGLIALIISASLGLFLYALPCELIKTNDSLDYLSAAQSFWTDGTFKSPDGTDYAHWPPLYPIVIALIGQLMISIKLFHGLLIVAIGLMLWNLSAYYLQKPLYRYLWLAAVLTSVQFLMVSVFLWSELLFLLLLLINLKAYLKRTEWKYWMILFVLTGLLMCLQRSAGFFWMAGMGWLLAMDKPKDLKNWVLSFIYCAISVSGLLYWILSKSEGNDTGFDIWEHKFFIDFGDNLLKIFLATGKFFLPLSNFSAWIWVLILVSILWLRKHIDKSITDIFWLMGFYTLGYALMQNLDINEIDRYYAVIYPFFFLLILILIERFAENQSKKVGLGLLIVFLIWMAYPLSRTFVNVERWEERSC